ncbi:MAG: hypothetical protein WBA93_29065 [Microcoleaceae cyanobacterium]
MNSPLLNQVRKTLSKYDCAELLAIIAGLQLMPENANRSVRLEALTHAVASINSKGFGSKKHISLKELEKICNSDLSSLASFYLQEDPFSNPFTEAFSFYGGSYIVFPGIAEEQTFILRNLVIAIFFESQKFFSKEFKRKAYELILAVLVLSNEIARRAGLKRGVEPVDISSDVVFPTSQHLNYLKNSVSFSQLELTTSLAKNGISSLALEKLILEVGNVSMNNYNIDNGELLAKPIVKVAGKFIVAIPGILLTAIRNELIRLAIEHGVKNELVKFYSNVIWDNIRDSLGYISNYPTKISTPDIPDIPFFQDAFFQFDTDKLAYVSLVSDSLDSYDFQQPLAYCNLDHIGKQLEARIKEIYEYVFTNLSGINEVLFLSIFQGVGRQIVVSFKQPEIESLLFIGLSAGDLETITLLEGGKPLVLWKYARSLSRLRQQANIVSFSELNNFFHYRKNDYSYYLSDESPAHLITILDGARELRREVIHQRDYHTVPSYIPNYLTEVTLLFSTREIPIYIPKSFLSKIPQPLTCLLETLPLFVWVIQKN